MQPPLFRRRNAASVHARQRRPAFGARRSPSPDAPQTATPQRRLPVHVTRPPSSARRVIYSAATVCTSTICTIILLSPVVPCGGADGTDLVGRGGDGDTETTTDGADIRSRYGFMCTLRADSVRLFTGSSIFSTSFSIYFYFFFFFVSKSETATRSDRTTKHGDRLSKRERDKRNVFVVRPRYDGADDGVIIMW